MAQTMYIRWLTEPLNLEVARALTQYASGYVEGPEASVVLQSALDVKAAPLACRKLFGVSFGRRGAVDRPAAPTAAGVENQQQWVGMHV
jgi:hypothetical protein